MHLASRFVVAALENATVQDAQSFFDDVWAQMDQAALHLEDLDDLLKHWGTLDALAAVRFSSFVDPSSARARDNRRLLALIEGALRLAALFHDLGHLPFSHDGEYALKDFATYRDGAKRPLAEPIRAIANAKAPHEEIGHALANIVFALMPETKMAVRHVYSLARKILEVPEPDPGVTQHPRASALQWLHSLVDGEIDVDRADYLLRDGQALGLDFAQYDLDRLVANLVLVKTPERGYTTAVKEHGLAALESYCVTRSRSHQVFVRHHKVSQVGTALHYALTQLMDTAAASPLLDFLAKLKSSEMAHAEERSAVLDQYAVLDDSWAFQALRGLQNSTNESLLQGCLGLALDRARNLRSIWKRKGDLTVLQMKTLRERVKELTSIDGGTLPLQEVRRRLVERGVLFALFQFKPYVKDRVTQESVMLILSRDGKLRPASNMSPLIRHLQNLWEEDIPLYAFANRTNPVTIDELLELMAPGNEPKTGNK
jgi:HD superfamily phosphohydrolase